MGKGFSWSICRTERGSVGQSETEVGVGTRQNQVPVLPQKVPKKAVHGGGCKQAALPLFGGAKL